MARILLLVLSIALISPVSAQFEVPNGDFEDWYQGPWTLNPSEWETSNFQLVEHVVPDSNSFEGDLAMRVYPFNNGDDSIGIAYVEIPTSAIPPFLSFAVKCSVAPGDTVGVKIAFWNDGLPENPIYSSTWFSANDMPNWTMINLPLNQIEPVMDYAVIQVFGGNELPIDALSSTTWISVDSFDTDFQSDISDASYSDCQPVFYPVPSQGQVNISTCDEKARLWQIYDLTGKLLETGYNTTLDLDHLSAGLYLGRIASGNGKEYTQRIIIQ